MLERSRGLLVLALLLPWAAQAQDGHEGNADVDMGYEDAPEPDEEAAQVDEAAPAAGAELDGRFDRLMKRNEYAPAQAQANVDVSVTTLALEGVAGGPAVSPEVVVPLPEWTRTRAALEALRVSRARPPGPAVVLGAAEYRGEVVDGALALTLRLGVTLGAPGRYKTVPLVGDDVVLVSATRDGRPLPVTVMDGYQVWTTRDVGEAQLEIQVLVPARGPRGSIEFELGTARTPVTRFSCRFATAGLEPRIDGAVAQVVRSAAGGTELEATLPPTTRVRLVGFKDLGATESRDTKVYAETSTLLSITPSRADVFVVLRYLILYGGTKTFAVALPAGATVVAADGEGAFRWVVEPGEGGRSVLRGETAFPIRGAYELSLRLSLPLDGERLSLDAPIPRAVGVEREHGWLAIEVPGRLRLEDKAQQDVAPIDVRQLPPEVVSSAVTPILRAYRYHAPTARVALELTRLPEKEPASAAIDRMRAQTVVSVEGQALTELKITLKNRLRPALLLTLPPGTVVRSTLLDGQPVKPSKNAEGQIMLPLVRSAGGERPQPFTLQVVLESSVGALGWLGAPTLALPAVDLPVSSLAWSVRVPGRNVYSRLAGEVAAEHFAGEGRWHRPVMRTGRAGPVEEGEDGDEAPQHGSASGAMPVRMVLPEDGVRLEYARYWLPEGRPVTTSFTFVRRALLGPLTAAGVVALGAVVLLGLGLGLERARLPGSAGRARAAALATAGLGITALLAWASGLATITAGVLLGAGAYAVQTGGPRRARMAIDAWWRTLPERWQARPRPEQPRTFFRVVGRLTLAGAIGLMGLTLVGLTFAVLDLLSRPL